MAQIGMRDAAQRLGVSSTNAALRLLRGEGVELTQVHARTYVVEEAEVEKLRLAREAAGYVGRGRPAGTFKPESPRSKAHKKSEGGAAST